MKQIARSLRRKDHLCFSSIVAVLALTAAANAALAAGSSRPWLASPGLPESVAPQSPASSSAKSLAISPKAIIIMAGQPQEFRLLDDHRRPVRDAVWTLSDPSLAEIKVNADTATVNGLARGKVILTAAWQGLSAQARITVLGESPSPGGSPESANWFQVTPDLATVIMGEPREFRMVDEKGKQIRDAQWSVSDTGLARITGGSDAFFTPHAPGKVTVTAEWQGHRAEAQVTVVEGPTLPEGTVKWSVKELPGFTTMKITPAVPSPSGVDIFATEADGCGRSIVRALTAEGLEVWRNELSAGTNPEAADRKAPFRLSDGTCPHPPPASPSVRR